MQEILIYLNIILKKNFMTFAFVSYLERLYLLANTVLLLMPVFYQFRICSYVGQLI